MTMAKKDPMKERLTEDIILEMERLHSDSATMLEITDHLRTADKEFREKFKADKLLHIDREVGGPQLVTDLIDHLLVQAEVQTQRTLVTVKRARETLKLSGL